MQELLLFIHFIGIIFGAGSVTTAYARELYFKKHPEEISKRGSLPVITPLINIGLALLVLSGLGLYLENPGQYNQSAAFLIKTILVIVLIANHIFVNAYIRPRHAQLMALSKITDNISLYGWYAIIAASVFL